MSKPSLSTVGQRERLDTSDHEQGPRSDPIDARVRSHSAGDPIAVRRRLSESPHLHVAAAGLQGRSQWARTQSVDPGALDATRIIACLRSHTRYQIRAIDGRALNPQEARTICATLRVQPHERRPQQGKAGQTKKEVAKRLVA